MSKSGNTSAKKFMSDELVKNVLSKPEGENLLSQEQTLSIMKYTDKLSNKSMLNLLAIEMGKGFKAFGLDDMKQLISKHMKLKYGTVHQSLLAARVAFSIGGSNMVGIYPDDAMRAMKKLTVPQRKEVFQHIKTEQKVDKDEDLKVSIKLVEKAIKKLYKLQTEERVEPKTKTLTDKQIESFFGAIFVDTENGVPNFAKVIQGKLTLAQRKELIKLLEDLDEPELDLEGA